MAAPRLAVSRLREPLPPVVAAGSGFGYFCFGMLGVTLAAGWHSEIAVGDMRGRWASAWGRLPSHCIGPLQKSESSWIMTLSASSPVCAGCLSGHVSYGAQNTSNCILAERASKQSNPEFKCSGSK
jgi:hypothetical protein